MFLCPKCFNGSCELRWNNIYQATELHCRRCGQGTIVLSEESREIH